MLSLIIKMIVGAWRWLMGFEPTANTPEPKNGTFLAARVVERLPTAEKKPLKSVPKRRYEMLKRDGGLFGNGPGGKIFVIDGQ